MNWNRYFLWNQDLLSDHERQNIMTWYVEEVILLPIMFDTDDPLQGTLFGLIIVIRLQRILFSNNVFLMGCVRIFIDTDAETITCDATPDCLAASNWSSITSIF